MLIRLIIATLFSFLLFQIHAQQVIVPPGGGGFRGGGQVRVMMGAGGGIQNRQQMLTAVKEQLEMSDEDFEKLSPRIEKVMDAKRNMGTGAGMSWTSQNGAPPVYKVSDKSPDTPVGRAMRDVRTAIADKDTPPDQITQKIEALNQAIEQARAQLATAQKELKDAITPRQQGILMMMGVVE